MAIFFAALAIPYIPALAGVFGFEPIAWPVMAAMIAILLTYIIATEMAKRWFYAQ